MKTSPLEANLRERISIRSTLRLLGIPVHRKGYHQLIEAIICFSVDETQSFTKEIYPTVARITGVDDWRLVERDIRAVVQYAWANRDPSAWDIYFHRTCKVPTNSIFISTLAELL